MWIFYSEKVKYATFKNIWKYCNIIHEMTEQSDDTVLRHWRPGFDYTNLVKR